MEECQLSACANLHIQHFAHVRIATVFQKKKKKKEKENTFPRLGLIQCWKEILQNVKVILKGTFGKRVRFFSIR